MNRKEYYTKRRVYRIIRAQMNFDYDVYPHLEEGKYWSGMNRFDRREWWKQVPERSSLVEHWEKYKASSKIPHENVIRSIRRRMQLSSMAD